MNLEKTLTVKVPDALGDTIIADAFLQFLADQGLNFSVTAKNRELLENRGYELTSEYVSADVSLDGYLDQLIHISEPPRTIRWYMANHGISQLRNLGFCIPDFDEEKYLPTIILTPEEDEFGSNEVRTLEEKFNKPVVTISWKSPTINRTWPRDYVEELFYKTRDQITYMEFVLKPKNECNDRNIIKRNYSLRQIPAVLKHASSVISIDTFTLHVAAAVGQKKIIGLFGSSRPETVCYEGVLDAMHGEKVEPCQYCGNHGYFKGDKVKELEEEVRKKVGWFAIFGSNGCIYIGERIPCMQAITPTKVIDAVRGYFL